MTNGNNKYSWDEWFKKNYFTLKHGRHFEGDPSTMCQQVRNAASRRGLSVSVRQDPATNSIKVTINGPR